MEENRFVHMSTLRAGNVKFSNPLLDIGSVWWSQCGGHSVVVTVWWACGGHCGGHTVVGAVGENKHYVRYGRPMQVFLRDPPVVHGYIER